MSAGEKAIILAQVENRSGGKRQALMALGIPKSSYYRWRRGQPDSGNRKRPWNRITPEEEDKVLAVAREYTELSSRQLAAWITDNAGFAVSESTVYRILRRGGLVKRQETQLTAANEYHTKTTRPHQMWATDASYFKVVGWGYYYLVTVMDDYSRFILAWELKSDMASNSLIDVVQKAVDTTGMTDVPVEDRTMLLSDNGPGYISRQFGDYLRLVGIRHILASPFHPQTNGKIERYHRTIKGELSLMPYEMPGEQEEAIMAFIEHYNYRRYHEGLGDVTPYDVYTGRHLEIIQKRKEAKSRTLQVRRDYNRTAREQGSGL